MSAAGLSTPQEEREWTAYWQGAQDAQAGRAATCDEDPTDEWSRWYHRGYEAGEQRG